MASEFRRLRAHELAFSLARDLVADQRRVLYLARGSLYETEHWIHVAKNRGLLANDSDAQIPALARTLTGLIRKRELN
jgi:four helix bundle protein